MKKLFIGLSLACFMFTGQGNAQSPYNYTYRTALNTGGNQQDTRTVDIVETANPGFSCMLGTRYSGAGGTQYNNLILLRGLDANGFTNFETAYTHPNILPTKLLYTPNGEFIVAGFHLETIPVPVGYPPSFNYTKQPFAAKFDAAGVLQWMQVYRVNSIWMQNNVERVNIVYCPDAAPGVESYIMTYPADQAFYPPPLVIGTINEDVTIGALRLDGTTGNPIWEAKYYMPLTPRQNEEIHGDYPHALAYGVNKYFISGITDIFPVAPPYYNNFMMSIDINGGVQDQYRQFRIGARTLSHDAIYDAGTNEFVMSMALEGSGVVTLTSFDVMKLDDATLNVNANDLYYDISSVENYARSIRETPDQLHYVIGGVIFGDPSNVHPGNSSAILKIEKTRHPSFLRRYNPDRYQDMSAETPFIDPNTGNERYRIGITPYGAFGPGTIDMRVITTDDGGDIPCWNSDRGIGTSSLAPIVNAPAILAVASSSLGPNAVTPNRPNVFNIMTLCTIPPGPAYKTLSLSNPTPGEAFKVYPTLLAAGDDRLNFEINATGTTTLTVMAVSMDGRTIGKYETVIKEGNNKLSWQLPANVPGNYILNITSADNSIRKTERISKL